MPRRGVKQEPLTDVQRRNVELVQRAYELVDTGGTGGLRRVHERYDEFCQPDFQWRPRMVGFGKERYLGRDGWGQFVDDMEATWEVEMTLAEIRAVEDDHVLFVGRLRLVGKGSGVPLDSEWAILYRLQAGLLQSGTAFNSHAEAEEAASRAKA